MNEPPTMVTLRPRHVELRPVGDDELAVGAEDEDQHRGGEEEGRGAEGGEERGGGDVDEAHPAVGEDGDLRGCRARLQRRHARAEHQHELGDDRRADLELVREDAAEDEDAEPAEDALLQREHRREEEPARVEVGEAGGEIRRVAVAGSSRIEA